MELRAGGHRREGSCRSCGSPKLLSFLDLGEMPLSDGFLFAADLAEPEPRFPLEVAFCEDCSLVQILDTVAPERLFDDDYPYFSSVSGELCEHARRNVEARIAEERLGCGSLVVELASNDGYLLQHYLARGVPALGIDPALGPVAAARERGIDTLHEFFTRELAEALRSEGLRADVVHANNVLAHVADLNGFVAGIASILGEDGVAVVELPYVADLVAGCEFDTIYHEHLCYFSLTALDALFRRHGLHLERVERLSIHGGSLRLFAGRRGATGESVEDLLRAERKAGLARFAHYEDFSARVEGLREALRALLFDLKSGGKRIGAYGAAAKGTILLNFAGIGRETLEWVADRSPHKQGRFVPGVRLPIVEVERLVEERPDYVLLLPWNFRDEILGQQRAFREAGGRFIVPVPRPEIL